MLSSLALAMISFFPRFSPLLAIAIFAFGVSGIGWNAIYLTIVAEAVDSGSAGLAIGVGYCFGFLGSLLGPPLFGFLVDRTGRYGCSWLFLTLCAAAIMILLHFYREKKRKDP
jgi:cyanate permease